MSVNSQATCTASSGESSCNKALRIKNGAWISTEGIGAWIKITLIQNYYLTQIKLQPHCELDVQAIKTVMFTFDDASTQTVCIADNALLKDMV